MMNHTKHTQTTHTYIHTHIYNYVHMRISVRHNPVHCLCLRNTPSRITVDCNTFCTSFVRSRRVIYIRFLVFKTSVLKHLWMINFWSKNVVFRGIKMVVSDGNMLVYVRRDALLEIWRNIFCRKYTVTDSIEINKKNHTYASAVQVTNFRHRNVQFRLFCYITSKSLLFRSVYCESKTLQWPKKFWKRCKQSATTARDTALRS